MTIESIHNLPDHVVVGLANNEEARTFIAAALLHNPRWDMANTACVVSIRGVTLTAVCAFVITLAAQGKTEDAVLTPMKDVPLGGWFRINIGGRPGLGIAKKTGDNVGFAGNQTVCISEPVWWVKNYIELPDNDGLDG